MKIAAWLGGPRRPAEMAQSLNRAGKESQEQDDLQLKFPCCPLFRMCWDNVILKSKMFAWF